jgi:hypothetical protein
MLFNRQNDRTLGRLSVSILEEGGPLGPKCLLLSYFRVGDNSTGTRELLLCRAG